MVKIPTAILSVGLLLITTNVRAEDTNCKGSYFCDESHDFTRCDPNTISKLRFLLHAEVQEGNGNTWYPSGGARIACLAAHRGACCTRWKGHLANGTVSEALHYMDMLLQHGCTTCGSTLLSPDRPGELTVNYEKKKHPDCIDKLCNGGYPGERPAPTWSPSSKTPLPTKTRSPDEQLSAISAEEASRSANALTSESKSVTTKSASKNTNASEDGDVTVTEKKTETMTVSPGRTVTKKETETVKVTASGSKVGTPSTAKSASKTPSMTTSVSGSKSSSEKSEKANTGAVHIKTVWDVLTVSEIQTSMDVVTLTVQ